MIPSPKSRPETGSVSSLLARWGFSWAGLLDNRRGEWWLAAQLLLIAAQLLPPWPAPGSWGYAWPLPIALGGAVLFVVALVLAALSLGCLGASLSPLPEPIAGAALVTTGVYSRCRHPLYQAVLLACLGLTLALGSLLHLALGLAMAAVLGGKARREERGLLAVHPNYVHYRRVTPAIIPGLPWLDWRA